MKWQSISICFHSWNTGLVAILIAPVLSTRVGLTRETPNSRSSCRSQTISLLVEDIDQYSASVKDLETVGCFLDFQDMGECPRNMYPPIVDLRVSKQPPQFPLTYAKSYRDEVEE